MTRIQNGQVETAVRNYEFFCLAALLVLLLVLFQQGVGSLSLLPFLIGLGGIAGRWRYAIPLLLGSLAMLLTGTFASWQSYEPWEEDALTDALLAGAALGYAAGQLRLQALAGRMFPPDPRTPQSQTEPSPVERPDAGREIAVLAVSLAVWPLAAQLAWEQLPSGDNDLGLSLSGWRLVVLTWLLGVGGLVGAGLVAYVNRKQRTATEAAMFLQDLLWRETRGEQRRLYRWMAWCRLRIQRRKERS